MLRSGTPSKEKPCPLAIDLAISVGSTPCPNAWSPVPKITLAPDASSSTAYSSILYSAASFSRSGAKRIAFYDTAVREKLLTTAEPPSSPAATVSSRDKRMPDSDFVDYYELLQISLTRRWRPSIACSRCWRPAIILTMPKQVI